MRRLDATRLARALRPWAERVGLEVRAENALLVRARGGVRHDVVLGTAAASGTRGASLAITQVNVGVGLRVEAVEAILDETFAGLGRCRPMATTVSRSLDALVGRARPRHLAGAADLGDVCAHIAEDLERIGLPWLEAHEDLASIERLLADGPPGIDAMQRRWVVASLRGTLAEAQRATADALVELPRFWREDFARLGERLARGS